MAGGAGTALLSLSWRRAVIAAGLAEEAEEFDLRLAEKTKVVLPRCTKMVRKDKISARQQEDVGSASTSMPNQSLEPTSRSVTLCAGAQSAPALLWLTI